MKSALKFVMALTVTILLMLAFRALAFTVYTVRGTALEPAFSDGDRVLVNRWSYGLRTGGGKMFRYVRWVARPVERGELVVFNNPADTARPVSRRNAMAYYCKGVPGDTVRAGNATLVVPGKGRHITVTAGNIALLCRIYNMYEGRKADIRRGRLYVDGRRTDCAMLAYDYYWLEPSRQGAAQAGVKGMLVPENHVVGRVVVRVWPLPNPPEGGNDDGNSPSPTLPREGA